ncbi:major facilitator superfamily domain-containing protein [Aspergillus varians]
MDRKRESKSSSEDSSQPPTSAAPGEKGNKVVDNTTPPVEPEYTTGLPLITGVASLTLVIYLMLLDTSIVSTAIPRITSDFHSLDDVGWYGTAYLVACCSVQPLTGKMYTYFNSKWTFIGFFTVFEIGSAVCGAAQSSNMLIVGRALAGSGASGLLNGAFTIMHASIPAKQVPALLGILMGLTQLGLLSGPLIGGALTQLASWRWCFYINLPCAALIYPALYVIRIRDGRTADAKVQSVTTSLRQLDFPGFALFTVATIQLLFALNWAGTSYAWNSATIIGLLCGAGGTFIIFFAWESYVGPGAMIPLSLVRQRTIWTSCLNYALLVGSTLCCTYYLPIYFQAVRDFSPTKSGVGLLPSIIPAILFSMIAGLLVGHYLPFAVASGAIHTVGTALLITLAPTTASKNWISFQVIQGIGRGLGMSMPLLAVQLSTPQELNPIATGLIVLAQSFGGTIFLSICQVVFSQVLERGLERYAPGVEVGVVVAAGAGAVREAVDVDILPGVLRAYNAAVVQVMYVATGAAAGALLFAFGMGWLNVQDRRMEMREEVKMEMQKQKESMEGGLSAGLVGKALVNTGLVVEQRPTQ